MALCKPLASHGLTSTHIIWIVTLMKINNFFNISVIVICGLTLLSSAYLAYKKPWVVQYQKSMGHYYTGFGVSQSPPTPISLRNPRERVSGYIYFLHQATISDSALYDVDLQCMQNLSGVDNDTFSLALDFVDTYYNYGPKGNLTLDVSDFKKRIDLLFGTDFATRHLLVRGGQMENQIALTKLEGVIAEKASILTLSEYNNALRECYATS